MIVGLQGVQGSGKSHFGKQLGYEWETVSIDDFYLPGLTVTRGPPGTHDIDWLERTLCSWKRGERAIEVPVFDKTLRRGRGDRSGTRVLRSDAQNLLLEGWCIGFSSSTDEILRDYSHRLWIHLDSLVVMHPPSLDIVYEWRRESEDTMSREEVTAFVDEYMPYYHAHLPALYANSTVRHVFLDDGRGVFSDPGCQDEIFLGDVVNAPNTFSLS